MKQFHRTEVSHQEGRFRYKLRVFLNQLLAQIHYSCPIVSKLIPPFLMEGRDKHFRILFDIWCEGFAKISTDGGERISLGALKPLLRIEGADARYPFTSSKRDIWLLRGRRLPAEIDGV